MATDSPACFIIIYEGICFNGSRCPITCLLLITCRMMRLGCPGGTAFLSLLQLLAQLLAQLCFKTACLGLGPLALLLVLLGYSLSILCLLLSNCPVRMLCGSSLELIFSSGNWNPLEPLASNQMGRLCS